MLSTSEMDRDSCHLCLRFRIRQPPGSPISGKVPHSTRMLVFRVSHAQLQRFRVLTFLG